MRPLITLLALLLLAISYPAYAERGLSVTHSGSTGKRIALVIGNGNYKHSAILQTLANPPHDAEDIAKALRGFGFEVMERKNQTRKEMKAAINEFSLKIGNSDAALFYYAGHGLQVKGQNFLVPVDASIESNSTDADLQDESINVSLILDNMDDAKSKVNIVMLDACRAPLKEGGKFRSAATRGLAAVSSQPKGTVIVYATDPGNVAADGNGRNGLFTAGLLTAFKGSDLSLRGVLVRTSKEVERGSDKKQTPYINGPATLQEEFRFGKGTQVASLEPVPTPAQPSAQSKSKEQIEDDTWRAVEGANTLDAYETYLSGYPTGRYAVQAKVKISTLKKQPVVANKPEPAAKPTQAAQQAAQQAKQEREAAAQQAEAAQAQQKQEAERQRQQAEASHPKASGPAMIAIPGKNYEMGKYEVTQKEWRDVMGSNPSKFTSCGDTCPVERVSWNDIQEFLQKLNAKTGKQYRLPTEAEWEYACYGGSKTEYCGGNNIDAVGWYGNNENPGGNSNQTTHPVGQKQANGYGLYDMSGNVREWQSDCWEGDCAMRALRGGGWNLEPQYLRADGRRGFIPVSRWHDFGFRLARTLP